MRPRIIITTSTLATRSCLTSLLLTLAFVIAPVRLVAHDGVADTVRTAPVHKRQLHPQPVDTLADTTTLFFAEPNPLYDERTSPLRPIDEDSLALDYERSHHTWTPDDDPYFARFNPNPNKAVWYAALFPGGGQIYNRKYWKLPIIYGGFLGLLYGYNWNQRYYRTYANAYRDLVLESPNASYLEFLPPTYPVAQRRDYLEKVFKRKKNAYRNYRDYCVVGMLGVYLVAMVDAYVDASLYHFDVSPELDAFNQPAITVGYTIEF